MHLRLIAVGDRQPSWVSTAFSGYTDRFPKQWRFQLEEIGSGQRRKGANPKTVMVAESDKILRKLNVQEQAILLDQNGVQLSSKTLATRLGHWQENGQDLAFIIGGPDGVAQSVGRRANFTWSLSQMTLPHGLARVLFAEQLYRAWSLLIGHPYHRE